MLLVKSSQTRWQATDLPEMFNTARIGGGGGGGMLHKAAATTRKSFRQTVLK